MKKFICCIAVALACASFAGGHPWVAPARAAARKNPVPANETSIALGKSVYERECLRCHGPAGRASERIARKLGKHPGDLSSPKLWEQTDGALLWKIAEGHDPMPSFRNITSDEERWPVINYIRTLAPKPAAPVPPKGETKS